MNSYALSRQWFDFAFENPDKITVTQGALYFWLIEVNNRNGWAERFAFNTEDACMAVGVNNRKTIWKALNELNVLGFVVIVFKSMHRHKPSVISLPITQHKLNGSLDKSLNYQSKERTSTGTVSGLVREQYADQYGNSKRTSKGTVSGHSNKQLNNETNKPLNLQTFKPSLFNSNEFQEGELENGGLELEFLKLFNELTGRKIRGFSDKAKRQLTKLKNKKFTPADFKTAITNGYDNSRTWDNPSLFTPEYITREEKFLQFLNWIVKTPPKKESQIEKRINVHQNVMNSYEFDELGNLKPK